MKYIKIPELENEIYVFDEKDRLCETCSYPLSESNQCLSCNIFNAKNNRIFTGGKFYFDRILAVGKYFQKGKSKPSAKQSWN